MTPFEQHLGSNESTFINPEKLSNSAFFDEMNSETLTRLQAEDEDTIIGTIEQCAQQDLNAKEFLEQCKVRFSDNLAMALRNAVSEEIQERQSESLGVTVPDSLSDTLQNGELDLSIERALGDIEGYIDTKLTLPADSNISQTEYETIKSNIGKLIGSEFGDMETIIAEAQEENPDLSLRELTWIINSKISEKFGDIRAYVLPPVQMYLKYSSQSERVNLNTYIGQEAERAYVSQRHPNPNAPANRTVDQMVASRERQYTQDYEYFEREMREMFINGIIHSVDELRNLDATLRVTQDEYHQIQADTRENFDVSLLNEADKQIESEAMCYFLFAVGVQCLPYVGGVTGAAVDGRDMFSNQDSTIDYLKQIGLIPAEFHIEKTTIDRLLAGAGIVLSLVGLQALAKSKKLAKAIKGISRIPAEQVGRMLENFGGKIGLSDEAMQTIKQLFGIEEGRNAERVEDGVETILNFSPEDLERLQRAGSPEVLGRRLSETQKQAIIDAHNVGERLEDGTYSLGDLREKVRILQEANFDSDEIRRLFDKNICGTEYPKFTSLYEDPRYSFLSEYRDVLGDISDNDIIGEGNNAIVLRNPENGKTVFKIAKPNSSHRLFDEYENHDEFVEFLDAYKNSDKITDSERDIIEGFDIPEITRLSDGLYEMERIEGVSFKSLIHLDYHRTNLEDVPENLYSGISQENLLKLFEKNGTSADDLEYFKTHGISDSNIMELLREKGLNIYPNAKEFNSMKNESFVQELISMWRQNEVKTERIDDFYELLRRHGYEHRDHHWGNFLIRDDGEIFMIDFGNSELRYNRTIIK